MQATKSLGVKVLLDIGVGRKGRPLLPTLCHPTLSIGAGSFLFLIVPKLLLLLLAKEGSQKRQHLHSGRGL